MKDAFGRNIEYMRISITDRCNLRCRYCMPDGIELLPMDQILTFEEISKVCAIAADLGISKIKLTGGEPLVRRGVENLVGMIKGIPGIDQVTMTTNGILLEEKLPLLQKNGLDAINVSLDTLDAVEFERITGRDQLGLVLRGLETAEKSNLPVKINTVNRLDLSDQTICDLMEYSREHRMDLRFIELMPIGAGKAEGRSSNVRLLDFLEEHYGKAKKDLSRHGNGPAAYYHFEGFSSSVGLISAMHGKFCGQCNRIRMSSTGWVKSCLCYEDGVDLREPLRNNQAEEVKRRLEKAVLEKPKEHCFEKPEEITENHQMVSIGG